jgi:hypothetical protein
MVGGGWGGVGGCGGGCRENEVGSWTPPRASSLPREGAGGGSRERCASVCVCRLSLALGGCRCSRHGGRVSLERERGEEGGGVVGWRSVGGSPPPLPPPWPPLACSLSDSRDVWFPPNACAGGGGRRGGGGRCGGGEAARPERARGGEHKENAPPSASAARTTAACRPGPAGMRVQEGVGRPRGGRARGGTGGPRRMRPRQWGGVRPRGRGERGHSRPPGLGAKGSCGLTWWGTDGRGAGTHAGEGRP